MMPRYLPFAAIALGSFALGWLVRPVPPEAAGSSGAVVDQSSGSAGPSSRLSSGPPLILPSRMGDRARESDDQTGRGDLVHSMADLSRQVSRARMARLSEALGFSADQEKAIGDLMEKRHKAFQDLVRSGKSPAQLVEEAGLYEGEFAAERDRLLDDDQKEALKAYESRQRENEIESTAQTLLGDIAGSTDLSREQRETVLEALRNNSAKAYDARPPGWDLMTSNYAILGTRTSAIIDDIGSVFSGLDSATDVHAMQKSMAEAQRRTASNRTEQLRSVLTPAQLRQYQTTLAGRATMAGNVPPAPPKR